MTDYPLNWGWDPDSADKSDNPASSPATQPYPLEWGYHTDVKNDTAPAARLRAGSLQGDPSDALPPDQSPSASQMPTPVARSLNGWAIPTWIRGLRRGSTHSSNMHRHAE